MFFQRMALGVTARGRLQWNNGFEAARTDYRLRSWPCLGKHSPGRNTSTHFCVTVKCVRCGPMLNYWAKEGFTGKGRETAPCPYMLAEVTRRLRESQRGIDEDGVMEALKMVKSEVKLRRTFPTQDLEAEFTPAPCLGWKMKNHARTAPVTPKPGIHHHIGDDEFGNPETP